MKRCLATLAVLAIFWGCSAEHHRQSADLQVDRILRDRKQQTLAYRPQVTVATAPVAPPSRRAYSKIPTTPIAPPTTAPIELDMVRLPYEPLGPDARWKDAPGIVAETLEDELTLRRATELPQLGPPAPGDVTHHLDLFGCIEYAVKHSREYQSRMEDLYLAALDVTLQRHLFSPRPFAQSSLRVSGAARDQNYRSALTVANAVGVRQQLPYGGEIVAQGLVDFVQALNGEVVEGESAAAVLSGAVPLLRGAGLINLEPLISSEREVVYQVREFEEFRRQFVVDIAREYFGLLQSQQNIVNRRLSLLNLSALTERTEALYSSGRLSFLEVQRSLQSRFQAESSLIDAEVNYQSNLDSFKITLGMPVEETLDVVAVQLDVVVPKSSPQYAVETALRYRLDFKTVSDRIEDAQRAVRNASNGLLPSLDLTGEVRVENPEGSPAKNLAGRTTSYGAGLMLDLPLDRVAERNEYRRALINLERAQRSYRALKDQITVDVRESLRSIESAEVQVEIARRGIELAQRRLDFSNTSLILGRTNARDVVEAQASLTNAQDQFERARSQLQNRVLEYMRATGTLRVDPDAGSLGRAMDRASPVPQQPHGEAIR